MLLVHSFPNSQGVQVHVHEMPGKDQVSTSINTNSELQIELILKELKSAPLAEWEKTTIK
jgi:hypothetical protein